MVLACVIQIDGWDPVAGTAVTLRAASRDDAAVCHLNGQTWWPTIAKLPTLRYDLFDGAFGGQITAPSATLTMSVEPWPEFGRYALADARFRLWTGELGADWAGYTLRFDGRVSEQPGLKDGQAQVAFAVDDRWLDTALLPTYAGTTGIEGPAALKGQAKPLSLGAPRYVAGTLIDSVNSVFQVSFGPIRAVDVALERLVRFGAPVADYPSHAALIGANVARGTWATCLASGLVRFGAPPDGQVSFLVRGDTGGPDGWARRPGQLVRRLALLSGGAGKVDDASLAALDAARPYNLSLYADAQTTARQLVQQLAASVNAVAGVSWTGQLFVVPVGLSAPTVTLAADGSLLPPVESVEQIGNAAPWSKLAVGAERAWTVHALSDMAFTAQLVDLGAYDAGTTYREGNIVQDQGSTWLYQNPTPTAGNAPPRLPTEEDSFWRVLAKAGADGEDGKDGTSAYNAVLSNETHTVPADAAGNVTSYDGAQFTVTILLGAQDVTGSFQLDHSDNPRGLVGPSAYPTFSITGGFDAGEETASVTYYFTGKPGTPHAGVTLTKTFSLAKSKGGADGSSPPLIAVQASTLTLRAGTDGNFIGGQRIDFTATRASMPGTTWWRLINASGAIVVDAPAATYAANYPGDWGSSGSDSLYLTPLGAVNTMNAHGGAAGRFSVLAYVPGFAPTDTVSIQKVQDGAAGAKGTDGANGTDGFIADSDVPVFVIECYSNGTAKPSWTGGSGAIRLTKGGAVITAGVTYSVGAQANIASLALNGATFSFAGLTADVGYFVINAIYAGIAYSRVISVKKVRDGSAAFRSQAAFGPATGSVTGSGNTTVPQNRTVTIAGNASYSAPTPGASQTTTAVGILGLYWRNMTDGGPLNFLGEVEGSIARSVNRSSNASEPDIDGTRGEVSASFSFTSPSPDKQIEYSAQFRSKGAASAEIFGNVALETVS